MTAQPGAKHVGPHTQRALFMFSADPLTQVSILRVFHNAPNLLTPLTVAALSLAAEQDTEPPA